MSDIRLAAAGSCARTHDSASTSKVNAAAARTPSGQVKMGSSASGAVTAAVTARPRGRA